LIEKAGSWKERVLGWETAYALIEKRPWAGHGPGTFLVNFQVQGLKHPNGYPVRWEQCHNDYLEMWIEWGLLGLIGAAGIALPALLQGLRVWLWARPSKFGGSDLHLARGLFFASLGVLLHAFVDFPLQIVTIRILATLMIAMLFCLPAWSCARSPE
jgi:O-antigen ligase